MKQPSDTSPASQALANSPETWKTSGYDTPPPPPTLPPPPIEAFSLFQHPAFVQRVRSFTDPATREPWFVARDVAIVLQYTNPAEAVRDHCKHVKILKTSDSSAPFPVPPRGLQVIPEGDVYRLVCRSRLPAAVKFQKWLFGEVLPSIRKRGGYVAVQPEMTEQELLARAVLVATETIKRVQQAKDNRSLCADASIGLPLTLDVTASPSSSPPDTGNSKK